MKTLIVELPSDDEEYKPPKKKGRTTYSSRFKKYIKNDEYSQYFDNTFTNTQKKKIIDEIEVMSKVNDSTKPILFKFLQRTGIPTDIKNIIFNKINTLSQMDTSDGEYHKLNHWVTSILSLPFNIYNKFPVHISDGKQKCRDFLEHSRQLLNKSVYGMEPAKMQIMQLLSQWIMNPESVVSSIALKGPMGTGKTTLLKNGISKILNREMIFIPLGGASEVSYLEGCSYSFIGSTYGKIIEALLLCKTNNPIIYFDELDKVSETVKGNEIINVLIHLTDVTQNNEFYDKYYSDIRIDMSKCLFIFSYNDEDNINKILRDRLYVIETSGYNTKDKIVISRDYLLPAIESNLNMKDTCIFTDDVIKYLIENKVSSELGVRNLKRTLENIFTKLNLYNIMDIDTDLTLFNEPCIKSVNFPYSVSNEVIDNLIQIIKNEDISKLNMYL
jgi:ATP-dependent Lon protease